MFCYEILETKTRGINLDVLLSRFTTVWYPSLPVQTPVVVDRARLLFFCLLVAIMIGAADLLEQHKTRASVNSGILNAYKTGFTKELDIFKSTPR